MSATEHERQCTLQWYDSAALDSVESDVVAVRQIRAYYRSLPPTAEGHERCDQQFRVSNALMQDGTSLVVHEVMSEPMFDRRLSSPYHVIVYYGAGVTYLSGSCSKAERRCSAARMMNGVSSQLFLCREVIQ
jgi:hypothetical protein